jgi:hypothetical protein
MRRRQLRLAFAGEHIDLRKKKSFQKGNDYTLALHDARKTRKKHGQIEKGAL